MTVAGVGSQFLGGSSPAGAVTVTCTHQAGDTIKDWVGPAGGAFNVAANWSPSGVPGATNVVCSNVGSSIVVTTTPTIAGANLKGSVTLTGTAILSMVPNASAVPATTGQSSLINNLTLNSGTTLGGSMSVDLTGTNSLAGNIYGTGIKTILSGATASLTPGFSIGRSDTLNTPGVLKNAGTMTWSGAHYLQMTGGGSILENLSGGVFNVQPDDGYAIQDYGGIGAVKPKVINDAGGTIDRVGVAGTTYFNSFFDNNGLTRATVGTISIQTGNSTGGTDAGTYNSSGTNTILLNGGTRTFTAAAAVTGTNGLTVTTGTLNFSSTPNAVSVLHHSGGSITGSYTVSGNLDETGGTNDGSGTTTISPGATANLAGTIINGSRQFNNNGTATWTGSTYLQICDTAKFDNKSGGVLNITADDSYPIYSCGTGNGSVINESGATINKSGATTPVQVAFNNFGTVNTNSGTLDVQAPNVTSVKDTGAWVTASGATLSLSNGSGARTQNASTFTGAGTVRTAGIVDFGTTNINVPKLVLDGGTLDGNVTITGSFTWNSGIMIGSGTTTLDTGITASLPAGAQIQNTHVLANKGTMNWSATGNIVICDSAVIDNLAGGVFNLTAADGYGIDWCGSTTNRLVNRSGATINKSTTATTYINAPFDNFGTVNVNAGTLTVGANSTSVADTGAWTTTTPAVLQINGDRTENASTFTGTGTVSLLSGTLNFGASTITVPKFAMSSGTQTGNLTIGTTFNWNGGTLSGTGTTTIPAGVTLTIPSGATLDTGHVLLNLGTATWGPVGNFYLTNGAVFENGNGATFNLAVNDGYTIQGGGTPSGLVKNDVGGTITRSIASVNVPYISANLDNMGTVNVTNGNLDIYADSSAASTGDTGTWNVGGGRTLNFQAGARKFNGGTVGGAGTPVLAGATFTGTPTITKLTWNAGTFGSPGTATVSASGTLTIAGSVSLSGKLVNSGTTTWGTANSFDIAAGGELENANGGQFNITQNNGYAISGLGKMTNDIGGTITRTVNSATSPQISVPFDNFGTVNVTGGGLDIYADSPTGSSGDTGTWNVGTTRTLNFGGGSRTFNGGTIGGLGTINLTGGTLRGTPAISKLNWVGGTFDYPGAASIVSGGTLSIGNSVSLTGKLVNSGTTTWGTANSFDIAAGGEFENASGGQFNITQNNSYAISGAGKMTNDAGGTITRTVTSVATPQINVPFDNFGTVSASGGNLDINASSPTGSSGDTGTWNAGTGRTINFVSGDRTFNGGTVGGLGTVNLAGSTFHGTPSISKLNWTSGTFEYPGQATVTGTLTIPGSPTLSGKLVNQGTITWGTAAASLLLCQNSGAPVLENANGGQFNITVADGSSIYDCGSSGKVVNDAGGTITKTSIGTLTISAAFDNLGTAALSGAGAGTISLTGNSSTGASDGGTYNIGTGKTLAFAGGIRSFTNTATINGPGATQWSGTTMSGSPTYSGTTIAWTAGTVAHPGTTTIGATATLNWNSSATLSGGHIQNNGTTNWVDGPIYLDGTATFLNAGLFDIKSTLTADYAFSAAGGTPLFTNQAAGTFRMSAAAARIPHVTVPFHNDGNVATITGTALAFDGSPGAFDNFAGNTLTGGTYTLTKPMRITNASIVNNAASLVLSSTGTIQDEAGTEKLVGVLASNAAMGSLSTSRALTTAPAFTNAGSVTVSGAVTLSSTSYTQTAGTTLVNTTSILRATAGTVAINGGTLRGIGTVNPSPNAVTGNGTVAPGVTAGAAGKLSVTGMYNPGASGTLAVDINGATTPGTDYDWLAASTSATLNGTLAITTGAFTPTLGQTFTILTTGTTRSGTFANVTGDDLPGGLYYDVSYTTNSVVLTVKAVPTITIDDLTGVEGVASPAAFVFNVNLSAASNRTVTVPYTTTAGTATAGTDYVSSSGTVTFTPGSTTAQMFVTVNADLLDEDDETFTVDLGTGFHATVTDNQALATIQDDPNDLPPTVSIDDQGVTEGDTGTSDTVFNVTLSGASGKTVTVPFSTTTGTAGAADFVAQSGTLTFNPGDVAKTVTVAVNGDLLNEASESYTVDLGSPTNATINDGSGTGTITDNDPIPTVSVADASITEPNAGTSAQLFHVSLSAVSGRDVTVPFSTTAGSALAGSDFTAVPSGSITILAGATGGDISIDVVGDTVQEPTETYTVNLGTPTNATVADGSATGTILDDDVDFGPASQVFPGFVVDDPRTTEGGTLTFTVSRVGNASQAASVKYATANGTATAGADYTAVALGTLSFAAGETSKTVAVTTLTDAVGETNETVLLNLSSPTNGVLADAVGTGTINDNAATPPTFIIGDTNVNEGSVATFTVTRLGDATEAATVKYATAPNTAVAPTDYTTVALSTLSFASGETTKTVNVTTINNAVDVATNKTFFVNLSAATNAGIADTQATGTIIDDEGTVVPGPVTFVAVNDVRQTEGGTAIVTITRRGDVSGSTTVTVNTGPGTASGGGVDFTSIPGQNVTFAATETTKTVNINTNNDAIAEQNETFSLNASSATGGAVREDSVGTITINDNDEALGVSAFSIDDVRVVEGQNAVFHVTRNGDVSQTAKVFYQTSFNTATSGVDFTAAPLTALNFAAGQASQTVSVATMSDSISETNELFNVNLSLPTNGGIADATGVGTITDKGNNPPVLSIGDVNVNEGSVATFTITRTGDTSETASVYYYTSASTATSPADYTNVPLTLATFNPGDTTKTFNVTTINNAVDVATNKVFLVNLSGWKNVGMADAQARGTIIDDEGAPVAAPATFLSISDSRVVEGAAVAVTITRRGDTSGTTTVKINTGPVTATGNVDFTAISVPQVVTFNPGETSKVVMINTTNDAVAEQHEQFTANLSANSAGSFVEDAVGLVTIDDND